MLSINGDEKHPRLIDEKPRSPPGMRPNVPRLSANSTSDKLVYVTQHSSEDIDVVSADGHSGSYSLDQLRARYPAVAFKGMVLMKLNVQILELQTILRDRETSRSDFIFYADRLIRLVVEEGLNQLPFEDSTVTTHTGALYKGLRFHKGICGVSIVRSGEAMEKGLRECCRSIRIGKLLVNRDDESGNPSVAYARFPPDIDKRKVLLMYPLVRTGDTLAVSIDILLEYGVREDSIYVLTLFTTPASMEMIFKRFPDIRLLTTEIHHEAPTQFGAKYFGTE